MNILDAWNRYGDKRFGSAGLLWNSPSTPGSLTNGSSGAGYTYDPKYFQLVQDFSSEGGGNDRYEATEHYNAKMTRNGQRYVQVKDPSRLANPELFEYDEEMGLVTPEANYKSDEDWLDKAFPAAVVAGLGGAMLPAMDFGALGELFGGSGTVGPGPGTDVFGEAFDIPGLSQGPQTGVFDPSNYDPFDLGGPGHTPTPGADMPHGTEIPNTYAPGVDPIPGVTPGSPTDWVDSLRRGVESVMKIPGIDKLPGLIGGIGAPGVAAAGGMGRGSAGGSGMGGYSPAARKPEIEMNPYAKQQKPETAAMLHELLKGSVR